MCSGLSWHPVQDGAQRSDANRRAEHGPAARSSLGHHRCPGSPLHHTGSWDLQSHLKWTHKEWSAAVGPREARGSGGTCCAAESDQSSESGQTQTSGFGRAAKGRVFRSQPGLRRHRESLSGQGPLSAHQNTGKSSRDQEQACAPRFNPPKAPHMRRVSRAALSPWYNLPFPGLHPG